ncbi:MAG: GAF domain-containing sensor histidine kinase [Gemmatimonadetes bacterium]|nr:GAF domain-containing sensor histidine kinase [Gemmatimonadota bacterium]MBT8403529.1 GAF domain-containing sensor histidine kinase [Gemmatimonadota bacterium]NNF38780.1 GAF domain-containing sensor histidine kinase [Gemmatimonadota bacterium]
MDLSVPEVALSELAAAYFQAVITWGLAAMCALLYRRYRKPHFVAWAAAWSVYALRMGAIISFMHTEASAWLFWHQVLTGWTALALLWAALVFWKQAAWSPWMTSLALFPLVWSYVAIYRLDTFFWAAVPAVAFLSLATAATAWAFLRYHRETGSVAAKWVAVAVALWAVHHLDYPFLRARGVWNPWGYYLDVAFELALGVGILFLVLEDLDEGLGALSALSAELQPRDRSDDLPDALMDRALTLRSVRGSALFLDALVPGAGVPAVAASGECAHWVAESPPPRVREVLARVVETGAPQVGAAGSAGAANNGGPREPTYLAALPVIQAGEVAGSLVVVGEARDPFTALDTRFLVALGQQVGAALENATLNRRLEARTSELERLQTRMVHRHEEERERISRELHDETAQILAAVNLRLGLLAEQGPSEVAEGLDEVRSLVGGTIRSIRGVTRNLRPVALDDLGLLPALRALARDLAGTSGAMTIEFETPPRLPDPSADIELALYRAVQEALANAVRHGGARSARIGLRYDDEGIHLTVDDDGGGVPEDFHIEGNSRHSGLAGIRERVTALGGRVHVARRPEGGTRVAVWVPWTIES